MSEHKNNPRALMHDTLPTLMPVGHRVGVDIQLQVVPKANVMLVPPQRMRTAADGAIEILTGDPEAWRSPPAGAKLFELGKPMPPEACDVVAILGTVVEDMLGPKLIGAGGQQPQGRVSSGPMAVIARAPLVQWQASHTLGLRGPVE